MGRISVCMGVYNGEAFLEEQLLSILNQTLKPDEVLLCDDGSTDRSVEKIQKFIEEHQPQGWRLLQNQKTKGYPGNYYYVMGQCTGDFVFLADQDDVWEAHKMERMTALLEADPQKKAVCCKFGLIDSQGALIHSLMTPAKNRATGQVRSVTARDVFYKCEWPGMVLAYRRAWFQEKYFAWQVGRGTLGQGKGGIGSGMAENGAGGTGSGITENRAISCQAGERKDPWPAGIPHDFLVCAWAAEEGGFYQLDEELAWHRRHEHNAGDEEHRIARLLKADRKIKEIENYNRILQAFEKEKILKTDQGKSALSEKYRVMRERYEALCSGSLPRVIKNAWENRRYTRLVTAVCDMAIACRGGRRS